MIHSYIAFTFYTKIAAEFPKSLSSPNNTELYIISSMDALDCIAKRIDNLNRILGRDQLQDVAYASANSESLSESLLSASTLLASATSGRDAITNLSKRSTELENYLDPDFLEHVQDVRSKEVYLQLAAPELQKNFANLKDIKKLESTLGAEYFRSMPDITDKITAMNEVTGELAQKNELLEESLTLAMQRYEEIHKNLKDSLHSMNERIGRMEEKMSQKKKLNEDV